MSGSWTNRTPKIAAPAVRHPHTGKMARASRLFPILPDEPIARQAADQATHPAVEQRLLPDLFGLLERHAVDVIEILRHPTDEERPAEAAEDVQEHQRPQAATRRQGPPDAGRQAAVIGSARFAIAANDQRQIPRR